MGEYLQYAGLGLLVVLACLSRPVLWLVAAALRRAGGSARRTAVTAVTERADSIARLAAGKKISRAERALIEEVFGRVVEGADRQLREVLVPRTEVEFLDAGMPVKEASGTAMRSPHSRYPVYRESHDEVIGFVHVRDLLDPAAADQPGTLVGDLVRPVKYVPASMRVLTVLSEMRHEGHHLAIVMDEYGGTAGIVTLEDLVEELIGDIRDEYDVADARPRRLHGGALEVDGLLNLDAFAAETGIVLPPGPYETVAGHIMAVLGRVPVAGDAVDAAGHRLTVARMDVRRVARVRVTPTTIPTTTPTTTQSIANTSARSDVTAPRDDASDGA